MYVENLTQMFSGKVSSLQHCRKSDPD